MVAAALIPLAASPAVAALPRADLSVRRVSPSMSTVTIGERVTFSVVAVNNGPAASDFNVEAIESQGLRLVRMTCAEGVSPDTPDCEYGTVPPGTRLVTKVVAKVTKEESAYAQVACTTSFGDTGDPKPGNDCKVARLTLQ